jgi:hypothetical protein
LRTPSPETIVSVSDPTPHPNAIASPSPGPHRLPAALLIRRYQIGTRYPLLPDATVVLSVEWWLVANKINDPIDQGKRPGAIGATQLMREDC